MSTTTRIKLGRRFQRFWMSVGLSNLSDGLNVSVAPLLAAALTKDPVLVSGVVVAQRLPWFLFSVLTGALADRIDRRDALVMANIVRSAPLVLTAGLLFTHSLNIWTLYVVFFALGIVETLFDNATFAYLPSLVDKAHLNRANGRLFATQTVANELVGPPIGGWLFALLGPIPLALSGGLYTASALTLKSIPRDERPPRRVNRIWDELKEGFSWYLRHTLIRTLSLLAAAGNVALGATFATLVLYAQERLQLGEVGFGLLLSVGAIGGILGGVTAEKVSRSFSTRTIVLVTTGFESLVFIGIGLTDNALVVGGLLALVSFIVLLQNVIIISLRQSIIPDELLGRVTSAYRMIGLAGTPLGAFLGGVSAATFGLSAPYILSGAFLGLVTVAIAPYIRFEQGDGTDITHDATGSLEGGA